MRSFSLPLQPPERDSDAFLGVEKSVRGLKWIERLSPAHAYLGAAISQRYNLPEVIGRLLAARQVALDDVPNILNPTIRALCPDPSTLADMDEAAARIVRAIAEKERVAIFGDYDVDGACAAALLHRCLKAHGLDSRIYIPDRIAEGYGPNAAAMATLIEDGATLIITVDCGSTSFDALEEARRRGADVVVVDHHQVGADYPTVTAFVNPNRADCQSGQGHLCAAGVVFLLCVAIVRAFRSKKAYADGAAPDLLALLDLVALATVCDVVPLHGVNRAFVAQGLRTLGWGRNVGLKALSAAAGVNRPPSPYTLGFILGPRINAGGRIGDSAIGAKLLATEDDAEARRIALQLDELNRERREIEIKTVEEAAAWADKALMDDPSCPIVVAGSPGWHKGLVGLAASRLAERFQRPCLVFAYDEKMGEATGSARSIPGVDIGAAVRGAVEAGLAKKGGGHSMAAGITVAQEKLPDLVAYLRGALAKDYRQAASAPILPVDGALMPRGATPEFVEELQRVAPFGQGNPPPRFCMPSVRLTMMKEIAGMHLRCAIQSADGAQVSAVAFRAGKSELGAAIERARDFPVHVAGRLELDEWAGRTRVEFQIEDIAVPLPARRS